MPEDSKDLNKLPVSEEEKKRIRKIIKDRAPSTRRRTSQFVFWDEISSTIGQPFNFTNIPLSKLDEMRRDPILAFAMHYLKIPVIRAPWRIDCEDPQIASFVDNNLRHIYARFVLQYLTSLDFGYQAIVKRFSFGNPDWQYVDPDDPNMTKKNVWDEGNIQAILWENFVSLAPELVEPQWNSSGEFDGIIYNSSDGTGQFPFQEMDSDDAVKVDLDHCQPPDEPVLTVNRGYIPIGELDENDKLVVWDKKQKRFCRKQGFEFEKVTRQYSGELITISTEDGKSTRVTPNHKVTVRWSAEAEDKHTVYLMKKGNWWRIGTAKAVVKRGSEEKRTSGVNQRALAEGADSAWILGVFDSKNDALFYENLWSNKYKVPDIVFRDEQKGRSEHCLRTEQLEEIWEQIDSETGAKQILDIFGLDENLPFYTPRTGTNRGNRGWLSHAANLISGYMEIPVDNEEEKSSWSLLSLKKENYEGDVVSLEVPPHNHYVSGNGVVVHNSLWITNEKDSVFGSLWGYPRLGYAYPYWWSYWFRWALADRAFEKSIDPGVIVRFPDSVDDVDEDGEPIDYRDFAFLLGENARSNDTVALPSTLIEGGGVDEKSMSMYEWDIQPMESSVNFSAFIESFKELEILKIRSLWLPEQALVEGSGGTSSRNVADTFGSLLQESQAMLMSEIDDHINNYMIPQLVAINFPEKKGITCKKVTTGFGENDIALSKSLVQLIGQKDPNKLQVDIRKTLQEAGVPVLSYQQIQNEEKKAAEAAAAAMPAAGPNVAQVPSNNDVGFEMLYTKPRQTIYLSETDSFSNKLPDQRHFQDKEVKKLATDINILAKNAYKDAYNDFLDSLPEDLELDETSDKIDKLLENWDFDFSDKITGIDQRVRDIMKRAGNIELSKIGFPSEFEINGEAENWAREHGAFLAKTIGDTTKAELRTFLAAELAAATSVSELADKIRNKFEAFPDWKATRLARTETSQAYNFGTLFAGMENGIKKVQAIDAQGAHKDAECVERNGRIFNITEALNIIDHPNGTLEWNLIKSDNLSVKQFDTDDTDFMAFYDEPSETIYLSSELSEEAAQEYLIGIVDVINK